MSFRKFVPIMLKLCSILFGTYYAQNYASMIYKGLEANPSTACKASSNQLSQQTEQYEHT